MSTILVTIFWNFTRFQYKSDSPQVKENLIISELSKLANLVYELPQKLPNFLSTWPTAQPSFMNLAFAKSNKKTCKNKYQTFLFLSGFTGLLHLVRTILSRIVEQANFLSILGYVCFQLHFWTFFITSENFYKLK